jgi:hypothetical protein
MTNSLYVATLVYIDKIYLGPIGRGITRVFSRGITRVFSRGITRVFSRGITRVFSRGIIRVFSRGITRVFSRGITRMFSRQGFHLKPVDTEIQRLHFTLSPATFYVSWIKNV